jgi:pimeloyl-ACP methyl ester carboxylesterase
MVWFLLGLAIALLAAYPFLRDTQRSQVRRTAPLEQFVQLSQGVTHYRWIGPVRGPVIVAIHGLTTPSQAYDALAEKLGSLGYRVLVYDLYGRGQSDSVPGPQDREFFLRQLSDLLEDQGLTEDLTLIGYSMGGSIATAFAAANPDRMKRLILLAPAGIQVNHTARQAFVARVPVLGDWLFHTFGAPAMRRDLTRRPDGDGDVPGLLALQIAQYDRKGFGQAVLASMRGMLAEVQEAEHRKLGREDVPVVGIWGEEDQTIPLSALGTLTQWNRLVRQETIPGAGHGLPYTHSTRIAAILAEILREKV